LQWKSYQNQEDVDKKYNGEDGGGRCRVQGTTNCGLEPPPDSECPSGSLPRSPSHEIRPWEGSLMTWLRGFSQPHYTSLILSVVLTGNLGALMKDALSPTFSLPGTETTKAVRIRIINMSAFSSFIIFPNTQRDMEIIEVDGVALSNQNVQNASSIEIHAGQRYSIIIRTNTNFMLHGVIGIISTPSLATQKVVLSN
jgi:hypothetical protein